MKRFPHARRRRTLAALILLVLPPAAAQDAVRGLAAAPFTVERSGTIADGGLFEASGMATSRRDDDVLWLHNDSGSSPAVHAVTSSGRALGRVTVTGATGRDWEDMASFVLDGRPLLLVADTGDNDASRIGSYLHVFEEPAIPAEGLPPDAQTKVLWSVAFRYPDGAADCEAVAVDAQAGQVLLMTKRHAPPRLYAVPLRPRFEGPYAGRVVTAEPLAKVVTLPRPRAEDFFRDPVTGVIGSHPTGMDLAGDQLLVLTYLHAYLFERPAGGSWRDAVSRPPRIVPLPRLRQGESIAFDRHGVHAYVSSERRNAPIYRLTRRAGAADPAS